MSHTGILDKIGLRFVKLASLGLGSKTFFGKRRNGRKSHHKNRQESDFYCKAFVNVSAEMISEFFE